MQRTISRAALVAALSTAVLAAAAPLAAAPPGDRYTVTPLASDVPGVAPTLDANLVNGWGLARSGTSPWWVADNGTDKTTIYNAAGALQQIGGVPFQRVPGKPTGAVFAGIAGQFLVGTFASPTTLGAANFIFASEDGMIRAWRGGSTEALVTAHGASGANYKGLAIAQPTPGQPLLYAADFHNARVDVFNGAWQLATPPGAFVDPELDDGFAPFGIQAIGSTIFVSYAKQDEEGEDEIAGQGRGFVDALRPAGTLRRARRRTRPARTRRGGSRSPRPGSVATEAISSSATSATGRSTPTSRETGSTSTTARSEMPTARSSRSTASGRSSSGTPAATGRRTNCSSPQARRTRRTGSSEPLPRVRPLHLVRAALAAAPPAFTSQGGVSR